MVDLTDVTVLIPAAGRVPEGLVSFASVGTPAMIPVAGSPVISRSVKYLTSLGARRFKVAVPQRGLAVEDFTETVFHGVADFEWIVPKYDRGAGGTALELLDGVEGAGLVVLGDTLFEFDDSALPPDRPAVLVHDVTESDRWCIVEADPDGMVTAWRNKVPGLDLPLRAAIGVYWLPDAQAALASVRASGLDRAERLVDVSALLEAATDAASSAVAVAAASWRDCGNPDTQEASRRQLLSERVFNSLAFDERLGTIRKSSTNRAKLIDEINYVRLLPADIASLFPRIVRSSTSWDDPWVEMEYYGYPTLTELYLYEPLRPQWWTAIFDRLSTILDLFGEHPRPVDLRDTEAMYVDKTMERVDACRLQPHLADWLAAPSLQVNGVAMPSFDELLESAFDRVRPVLDEAVGAVVHGDFCFSNILYDLRTGVCKLLDPRGSFGSAGIFGDQRYDVAKLHHSIAGGYDHLVAGLYRLGVDGGSAELDVRRTESQLAAADVYREVLLSRWQGDQISLITALMFSGLASLHSESPERQLAMLVRASQLLFGIVNEDGAS